MKLFSTLAIFIASFISATFAGDCNNPLLTIFDISSLETPTEVTDIKYCKSLQSSQSCCSADTINGFQAKADALAEKLKAIVATRDKQIVETRDKVIPELKATLQDLKENSQKALNILNGKQDQPGQQKENGDQPGQQNENGDQPGQQNGSGDQPGQQNENGDQPGQQNENGDQPVQQKENGDQPGQQKENGDQPGKQKENGDKITKSSEGFSAAASVADSLGKLSKEVVDGLSNIKGNFTTFQKSRSTCVIQMIKLQAAAWCLSCDPEYASKGVSESTVLLSGNVCGRLQGSCYEFITQSSQQSSILSLKNLAPKLGKVSDGLKKIISDNSNGLSELADAVGGASNGDADAAPPVAVPDGCTSSGQCSWICTELFKDGQVNEILVSAGGEVVTDTDSSEGSSRILIEEGTAVRDKLMKKRALQASEWSPDQDEAGIQVTFIDDPAGMNIASSSSDSAGRLIRASLMGLVALIAIFMM